MLKSKRKVLNKGLILIICHCLFLHIFRICPGSGSGSDFYNTNPDSQIRIRITGPESIAQKQALTGSLLTTSLFILFQILILLLQLAEVVSSVEKQQEQTLQWKSV